jgi:site-specific DNA recombinase
MKETQAKRALAEARLNKPKAVRRRLTEEEISELVASVDSIMQDLKHADRADKADLYSRLQVTLKYYPNEKRVAAEARPASIIYVGACPRPELQLTYIIEIALTVEFTLAAS